MNSDPGPVLISGFIASVILLAGPYLARWGIDVGGVQAWIGKVLGPASPIAAILLFLVARSKVTPTANPIAADGITPLVPGVVLPPAGVPVTSAPPVEVHVPDPAVVPPT